ncbi:hypothetical protein I302_102217 [Kwoniella bestiolae CBS 10118]|uniref:CNH domain-containing protein n=1 Tax=Kwoniella bestiolae CBS 10118 TaxID=1296100 RepID=A0A1B9GEA6_9TREE|nr:hypothetical protein I302_00907 [Kwoniella bestiolae CBS 10118]OCF29402.1 hypothetical protein I302_00907 [Kwoniella bestiolae CBS 10118]
MAGFSIYPLLPSLKAKVTAIHQHDDRLYVGLANGSLQIYSYDTSSDDETPQVGLLKTHTLSRRQIDQIGVLGESRQLVVLSDTVVTLYSLPDLPKKGSIVLNQARSAHCFANTTYTSSSSKGKKADSSDPSTKEIRELLIVGCRKKVVVYGASKEGLKEGWELNLPHSPRHIIFPSSPSPNSVPSLPQTIHLLFTPQTSVLLHINPTSSANRLSVSDITTSPPPPSTSSSLTTEEGGTTGITMGMGALTGLGGYVGLGGKSAAPLGTRTVGGEVLLARDDLGAFLSSEGNYTRTESLQWPGPPDALAFANPYIYSVVPVLPSSSASTSSAVPVPTVHIHLAPTLALRQALTLPTPSIGGLTVSHMATTKGAIPSSVPAENMTSSTKMLIVSTPTDRHLSANEGSSIWALRSSDTGEEVDQLVKEGRVGDAIGLVEVVGENGLSPSRRLPHLKTLQAVTQLAKGEYQSAMEIFLIFNVNPALVLSLFPAETISGRLHVPRDGWMELFGAVDGAKLEPSSSSTDKEEGVAKGLLKSVAGLGGLTKKGSVTGLREMANDTASIKSVKSVDKEGEKEKVPIMKEEDPIPPRAALEALMYFLSDRRQKLAGAMTTNPLPQESSFPPLSSLSAEEQHNLPSIPFTELTPEQLLRVAQVIYTGLIKVYLVARPVLVGSLCRIENWCDVEEVEELLKAQKKFGDLIDLYQGKKMHSKALKMLHELAKDEEDKLDRYPPTIRYLQKLGPSELDLILNSSKWIFEEDSKMALQIFTADEPEVESLPRSEVMRFLEKTNEGACIGYLEHIINNLGEEGPDYHDKLAELYHARMKSEEGKNKGDESQRPEFYETLLEFLEKSKQYRPYRLISKLAAEEMPEARAILLGRMGKHEEALKIYVYRLRDYTAAETYCVRVYPANDDVFLTLLKIYLRPTSSKLNEKAPEPLIEQALSLVSKHSTSLPPSPVLDLLPPLVPIQDVHQFFMRTLRDSHTKKNESRVLKSLMKGRKEELERMVLSLEGKRVRVTDQRICPQCHKRLGQSAIAVHAPRGEVTHLHCKDSFSSKLAKLRG